MAVAWVCRTPLFQRIEGAVLAAYSTPSDLAEWRRAGMEVVLIDFGPAPIVVGASVPDSARVLDHG